MGRPINKKYFGDANYSVTGKDVGGENVVSVANATGLSGMTFASGGPYTILAADITAPQIAGGSKPVLSFQPTSATAGTITVVSGGAGYTSAPTVTVRGSLAGGTGTATPLATLNTTLTNAITCTAYIPVASTEGYISGAGGSSAVANSDIVRQVGTRKFVVESSQGVGRCTLKATAANAAGEMNIIATDSASGTYFVTKLTNRKAYITRGTGTEFVTGAVVQWTLGSAVLNTSVSLTNG